MCQRIYLKNLYKRFKNHEVSERPEEEGIGVNTGKEDLMPKKIKK